MNVLLYLILGFFADGGLKASGGPLSDLQSAFDSGKTTLALTIDPDQKTIKGYAETLFHIKRDDLAKLELELAHSLIVTRITTNGKELTHARRGEQLLIDLPENPGRQILIRIEYGGQPLEAKRPPWDGGFNWSSTDAGVPWVGVSCQGMGGKVWYPCKTHPSDKIDGISLEITIPESLYCAANGQLKKIEPASEGWRTFFWEHAAPIATYNISINIADYEVFERGYRQGDSSFPLYFYFLEEYQKADQLEGDKRTYQQKKEDLMRLTAEYLSFFESYYGPYPFDVFKIAHTDYRGMEHQTINSYGEHFRLDDGFDFLLFHEMGHEWWGNKIAVADWAHFWIHEGICTYATGVYLEENKDFEAAAAFFRNARHLVENQQPLVPGKDLDSSRVYGGDVYYKGALMLHALRNLLGKQKVDAILKKLATDPVYAYPQFVATSDFIALAEKVADRQLDWFFDVYLYQAELPELKTEEKEGELLLSWEPPTFVMPLEVRLGEGEQAQTRRVAMPDGSGKLALGAYKIWQIDPRELVLRQTK